jgi:hypothetical protein
VVFHADQIQTTGHRRIYAIETLAGKLAGSDDGQLHLRVAGKQSNQFGTGITGGADNCHARHRFSFLNWAFQISKMHVLDLIQGT